MTVSHELRTPLTAIRGHVAALREGVVDRPGAARASRSRSIAQEAERLERLVGDVLDLAKLDAHRFTVLHRGGRHGPARSSRRTRRSARRRGGGGSSTGGSSTAAPVIVSDGDRVLQIISNLLSNAFRWTPDGGRIDLELRARTARCTVAVDDTGPGTRPSERERIFRPFWSRDGRGTGLGLAIARELAVALGGRIELESEVGQGSRFGLVLPTRRR